MACKKGKLNFKIYDVINWETNDYNTYIVQYRKKERQSDNEIWSVSRLEHEEYFFEKSYTKCGK